MIRDTAAISKDLSPGLWELLSESVSPGGGCGNLCLGWTKVWVTWGPTAHSCGRAINLPG